MDFDIYFFDPVQIFFSYFSERRVGLYPDFSDQPKLETKSNRKVMIEILLKLWVEHIKQAYPLRDKSITILKDYIDRKSESGSKKYVLRFSKSGGFEMECASDVGGLTGLVPEEFKFSTYAMNVLEDKLDTDKCGAFVNFIDNHAPKKKKSVATCPVEMDEDEDEDEAEDPKGVVVEFENGNVTLTSEDIKKLPRDVKQKASWISSNRTSLMPIESLNSEEATERFAFFKKVGAITKVVLDTKTVKHACLAYPDSVVVQNMFESVKDIGDGFEA